MVFSKIINKIRLYFLTKKNIRVGKNTRILTSIFNFGSEPYLVSIGSDCIITSGVRFITHDASVDVAIKYCGKNRVKGENKAEIMGRISVGNNCMIGVNSIILPGVKIGDNCIIGAGSVVTKSIPSNSVVAGNPAKIISSIEEYAGKITDKIIFVTTSQDFHIRREDILRKLGSLENDNKDKN